MSASKSNRRFMTDRSSRLSESDAASGFRFSQMEEHENEPIFPHGRLEKYAVDDCQCIYGGTSLEIHRSNSYGSSFTKDDPDNLDPLIVKNATQLAQRLELMHDRCIQRNLHHAGLGGFEAYQDDTISHVLDPNARMMTGEPMLIGIILNFEDIDCQTRFVSILLSEGADVNAKDDSGKTALMHACERGYERAVKILLQDDQMDLLETDNEGNTALMYAAANGSIKILKLFLKSIRKHEKYAYTQRNSTVEESTTDSTVGEQWRDRVWSFSGHEPLDMENSQGNTARALALKNGHLDCANFLNDERSRRVKCAKRATISRGHEKLRLSPSMRRQNGSTKKHISHSTSFDSVYYERNTPSRDRDRCRAMTRIDRDKKSANPDPNFDCGKVKKHFQSNPDLIRVRASSKEDELSQTEPISVEIICQDADEISNQSIHRRQIVSVDSNEDHRPIIGSAPNASMQIPKRNLGDRLMSFLRRRPKYLAVVNDSDTMPNDEQSKNGHPALDARSSSGRSLSQRKHPPPPNQRSSSSGGFNLITLDTPPIQCRSKIDRSGKKNSISESTPLLTATGNDSDLKRRSIDLSFMSKKIDNDQMTIGQTTITPLLRNAVEKEGVCLPRLQSTGNVLQKQRRYYQSQKIHEKKNKVNCISNEETADSGLGSASSSGTATSRPVSAESNASKKITFGSCPR